MSVDGKGVSPYTLTRGSSILSLLSTNMATFSATCCVMIWSEDGSTWMFVVCVVKSESLIEYLKGNEIDFSTHLV